MTPTQTSWIMLAVIVGCFVVAGLLAKREFRQTCRKSARGHWYSAGKCLYCGEVEP